MYKQSCGCVHHCVRVCVCVRMHIKGEGCTSSHVDVCTIVYTKCVYVDMCVPMCEAHTTHQLHSSNISVHGVHKMETLVCVYVSTSRATTASV